MKQNKYHFISVDLARYNYTPLLFIYVPKIRETHKFQAEMCPNFGHLSLTSSLTKYQYLQMKNSFATIVNEMSVLKLFQLSNGYFCSMPTASIKCKNLK